MANDETRRQTLKKIGLALAATAAGGAIAKADPAPPMARTMMRTNLTANTFKVPAGVATVARQGAFDVYVAHQGADASLLIVPSSNSSASKQVSASLGGAAPAKATIVNGVVHVGLGAAGASRSSVAHNGAIDFRGASISSANLISR